MAMVFCRGCGKEIHETAPTCPQCGAPQFLPTKPIEIQSSHTKSSAFDSVSESWRNKFRLIEKAGGVSRANTKTLPFGERLKVNFNIWGFLFATLYYLVKGMWKKAFTLTIIALIVAFFAEIVRKELGLTRNMEWLTFGIIFGSRATIDYYKKIVLNDRSWL